MKRNLIVYILLGLILAVGLLLIGCGDKEEAGSAAGLVTYDDAVIDGSLTIDGIIVTQTMVFKEEISLEDITRLVEEKAAELKAEYPDSTINVQAAQKGRNVSDLVLE